MKDRVRRAARWLAVFGVLGAGVIDRGVVHAADLVAVYERAKVNDPTFQSARYAFEAAKQRRPEAFSALLPSVVATATGGYTAGSTTYSGTPAVNRGFKHDEWALQLTQPIFRAENLLNYDEARVAVEQASAQYGAAAQDLLLRVARAYFDVVVAERGVVAADAQVKALDEQLSAARRSFQGGIASITDVDDTQSRAALAAAQRVAALNERDATRAALDAIIGPLVEPLAVLRAAAPLPQPTPNDIRLWVARASEESPTVLVAKAAVKVAEYEMHRHRAQRLPAVDLVASYGGNYSSGNITNPTDYAANVRDKQLNIQISMPLADGGGLAAHAAEARAKHGKAQADLDVAQRAAALDARQAYSAVMNGVSQIQALQIAVTAGQSAVKGNRIGYGLGLRINSDVLNAEQQLYSTERDLDKARYDTVYQGLKLKAAAGELSERDLQGVNDLLGGGEEAIANRVQSPRLRTGSTP